MKKIISFLSDADVFWHFWWWTNPGKTQMDFGGYAGLNGGFGSIKWHCTYCTKRLQNHWKI